MLPHDLPDDVAEVKSDGFMKIEPLAAFGVSLMPQSGNVGGYPLIAYVNGDERTEHVIRGPGFLLTNVGQITTLKVDARPGGGAQGDSWNVTVLPVAGARLEPRFLHDGDGFLATRNAGYRTLFDLNTGVDLAPFLAAFGGGDNGTFCVIPSSPKAFTKDGTDAWDVSRFTNVLLAVDFQTQAAGLAWSFQAFVDGRHSTDGSPLKVLGAGTDNEFGASSGTPWPANAIGYVHLGAGAAAADALTRETPSRFAFARFRFEVSLNTQTWETVDWTQHRLRLRAIAW